MQVADLEKSLQALSLVDRLGQIRKHFDGDRMVFSTSFGQEDQVITDVIFKNTYFKWTIVNSVFEYLKNITEVDKTLDEMHRVTQNGIYIGNLPRCKT